MNPVLDRLSRLKAPVLAQRYRFAQPFPHLVLDDVLPEPLAHQLEQDCRAAPTPTDSSNGFTQAGKLTLNDWALMPETLAAACGWFQSGAFVTWLEAVTGLPGLIPDPHLEGGGLHRTASGGFLKLHTDFNWNPRLCLYRRLNVLLYLNSGYQADWGGQLLLTRHPARPADPGTTAIEPIFNRLVLFDTNDTTFHGHPEPHRFPAERPRTSLAFYYYSAAAPPGRLRRRLRSVTTRYVLPPQDAATIQAAPLRRRLGYWWRRWTPWGDRPASF